MKTHEIAVWITLYLAVLVLGVALMHQRNQPTATQYNIEHVPNPDGTYDLRITCPNKHFPESTVVDGRLYVSCDN